MNTYLYEFEGRLYINLTNKCSNSCNFCIRNGREGVNGHYLWLDIEPTVQDIIEQLEDNNMDYDRYIFCGFGEPIYKLDVITEVGKYLKSKGKFVRINTNGHGNLIHNKNIVPILAEAVNKVSISLNASNAKEYQRICNSEFGEDGFNGMIDFAKKCKEFGLDAVLSVVDCIGKEEIDNCQKLADSLDIPLRVRVFE